MQVLADTWPLSLNEAAFRGVSSWTSRKRCSMGQRPPTLSGGALWESRCWVLLGLLFPFSLPDLAQDLHWTKVLPPSL